MRKPYALDRVVECVSGATRVPGLLPARLGRSLLETGTRTAVTMDESRDDPSAAAATLLARRRARLERVLSRHLAPPGISTLPPRHTEHLIEDARELFWNELTWELLTADERERGSQRVESMFAGLLAFVEGLLVSRGSADGRKEASAPRSGVVEEFLLYLAGRCQEPWPLTGPDAAVAGEITTRLLDLMLYRLHELTAEEIEKAETARLEGDE